MCVGWRVMGYVVCWLKFEACKRPSAVFIVEGLLEVKVGFTSVFSVC